MAKILLLETATEVCSVALAVDGEVAAFAESKDGFRHAEQLTLFAEQVLRASQLTTRDLDAVCVSRGPGSYTGLRIGVSTAKGLCYALGIPLLAVSTLEAMASHVASSKDAGWLLPEGDPYLCPMLDARRMEVYYALYDLQGRQMNEVAARVIDGQSFEEILSERKVVFFGNGAAKCQSVITSPNALFIPDVQASARFMSKIAQEQYNKNAGEDVSYFEPYYLKDFMATVPRNKVF